MLLCVLVAIAGSAAELEQSEQGKTPAKAFVWALPLNEGGVHCYELPNLDGVVTLPRALSVGGGAGDLQGELVACLPHREALVYEPRWRAQPIARIKGEPTGACFSPDNRHLACVVDGKLGVYALPDPGTFAWEAPPQALKPLAQAPTPAVTRLLWPPESNVIIATPTREILAESSTPKERIIKGVRGCAFYLFEDARLTRVLERPDAIPSVAASLEGHALIVSQPTGSAEPIVEWVSLKPGYAAERVPVSLGHELTGVAIAGDLLLFDVYVPGAIPNGADRQAELVGWDRVRKQERFRLTIPTWLSLYPQEALSGYAVATVSPGGPRMHHGDLVCLDCTREWPSVVARVNRTDSWCW
jgi:hypothetical protein